MNDVRETVAKNIKGFREQAEMTQRELSDKLGIAVTVLSNWENNVSSPSIDKLAAICDALGVKPTVIMGLVDEYADKKTEGEALLTKYNQAPDHIRQTVDTLLDRKR